MIEPGTVFPVPLAPADHSRVMELFRRVPRQHLQLDWRSLSEWLSHPDLHCWVIRKAGRVQALLGATVQPSGHEPPRAVLPVAWLRLLIPSTWRGSDPALDALWEALQDDLRLLGVEQIALLVFDAWVESLVRGWGFRRENAVVTLRREGQEAPVPSDNTHSIREARPADLDAIARLDAAAFEPLWHYNREILEAALPHAATFTVLEEEGHIVGYQLSTRHLDVGHLARLAVHPERQGRGLGRLLVEQMLRFFEAQGVRRITVNTQEDNLRSQRLYRRLGFRFTGHRVPLWVYDLR